MPWNATQLKERFDAKWRADADSGCWVWTGARAVSGYGKISLNTKLVPAHRLAWSLYVAAIPDGMTIDHKCRRRECVNPAHLEVVTAGENSRRRNFHYWKNSAAPEPIAKIPYVRQTFRESFDAKWKLVESGCWEWQRMKDSGGYGRIAVEGRPRLAHRIGYELYIGKIPDGLTLDHLCRNRACVNPSHLEPVTMKENTQRGMASKCTRERNLAKTHCKRGHPLSGENLVKTSKQRSCRTCRNLVRVATRRAIGLGPNFSGLAMGATISAVRRKAATHCKRGHEWTVKNTGSQKGGWRSCRACARDKSARYRAMENHQLGVGAQENCLG